MSETKIYVPRSSAKTVTFKSGKSVLKLSFKADEFAAFIKQHANSKGYINLGVSERKEVGQYGDTHCVWLDTWEPTQRAPQQSESFDAARKPTASNAKIDKQDVPF